MGGLGIKGVSDGRPTRACVRSHSPPSLYREKRKAGRHQTFTKLAKPRKRGNFAEGPTAQELVRVEEKGCGNMMKHELPERREKEAKLPSKRQLPDTQSLNYLIKGQMLKLT